MAQILLETLICQQPISFIKDQKLQVLQILDQICLVMYQLVNKPSWCRYDNMWDISQFYRLLHHVHAADDHAYPQVDGLASKDLKLITDLERQFSCWR